MASDEVRLNGVVIGRTVLKGAKLEGGRVSFSIGFKPDHVGIMHAGARELDKDGDR
jgi:hypothetical protein